MPLEDTKSVENMQFSSLRTIFQGVIIINSNISEKTYMFIYIHAFEEFYGVSFANQSAHLTIVFTLLFFHRVHPIKWTILHGFSN